MYVAVYGCLADRTFGQSAICGYSIPLSKIIICLLGVLMSCSFYRYPEILLDLIAYHNMYIYAMVSFSTGKLYIRLYLCQLQTI